MHQISPVQLRRWLADGLREPPLLLDVRESWEHQICHIPNSLLAPMHSIPARLSEFETDTDTVVICHHGIRSYQAALYLERSGFSNLYNLTGGVDAWARSVEASMPVY